MKAPSIVALGLCVAVTGLLTEAMVPQDADALVLCVQQKAKKGRTKTRSFFRNSAKDCPRKCVNRQGDILDEENCAVFEIPTQFLCWDRVEPGTNLGNGKCDPDKEDVNKDGLCTPEDCRGINCWDENRNGIDDPGEDRNGDGQFTPEDCVGGAGPPGINFAATLDIGDDGGDDDEALREVATTRDPNEIFSQPLTGKLLVDVGKKWPVAAEADRLSNGGGVCDGPLFVKEVDDDGSLTCTQPDFADLSGVASDDQIPNDIEINLAHSAEALEPGALDNPNEIAGALCSGGEFLQNQGGAWACSNTAEVATTAVGLGQAALDNLNEIKGGLCPSGHFLQNQNGAWTCSNTAEEATTANNLAPGALNALNEIAGSLCPDEDQLLKRGASGWICDATAERAAEALALGDGALDSQTDLSGGLCSPGQFLKKTVDNTAWACADAADGIRLLDGDPAVDATVDITKNLAIDPLVTPGQLVGHDGTGELVFDPLRTASIAIMGPPQENERVGVFRALRKTRIHSIDCIVDPALSGRSANVSILALPPPADGAESVLVADGITCDTDGTSTVVSLDAGEIEAGSWVYVQFPAQPDDVGSVTHLTVAVNYTIEREPLPAP